VKRPDFGRADFNIMKLHRTLADFIQYVNGPTNTVWGARRLADGHPQPYNLKYLELGNEEAVNSSYYQKFQAMAQAIWAVDTNIILVVGIFLIIRSLVNPFSFQRCRFGHHDTGCAPTDFTTGPDK